MSIQSIAGCQQNHQNCLHNFNNSFSSTYQPQAQDPTNAHNSQCFESPYDKYQMSPGQTNGSDLDNLVDTEAWISE